MKAIQRLSGLIIALFIGISEMTAATILVGAASTDITPRLPAALDGQMQVRIAKTAETPLTAQVVVMESVNGTKSENISVFVTCDIVTVPTELKEMIQAAVKKQIPALDSRKIIVNASHTHTGGVVRDGWYTIPEGVTKVRDYQQFIAEQVSKAVATAWNSRERGSVAWGLGYAKVAFNRRAVYAGGNAQMYGKTDGPDFRGIEGYEDQSINSLFFWNASGKLLAVCINVASPAQIVEGRSALNADYWHPLREKLKKQYGNDLAVLGWIGAAGDQTPRPMYEKDADRRMLSLSKGNYTKGRGNRNTDFSNEDYMDEVAGRIVKSVNETYELVKKDQYTELPVMHEVKSFDVKARVVTSEEKEACLKSIAEDKGDAQRAVAFSRRIAWNQEVVDRFEKQKTNPQPMYTVEAHVLRIGDIAVCTNPFELYTEFGIQLKARSKALQTFIIQLVGPGTYVPTKKATEGGHYSAIVQSNRVGYEGGQELVDNTLNMVNSFWND